MPPVQRSALNTAPTQQSDFGIVHKRSFNNPPPSHTLLKTELSIVIAARQSQEEGSYVRAQSSSTGKPVVQEYLQDRSLEKSNILVKD